MLHEYPNVRGLKRTSVVPTYDIGGGGGAEAPTAPVPTPMLV